MFAKILFAFLLALITPTISVSHQGQHLNRHVELSKRVDGDVQLFKRTTNSRWTYYDVEETGNAGSCGKHHVNTDFTVAMNAAQMNPAWCFKTITLTLNGKTTTADISDTCPGCPYGGLDLTEGLFAFFLGHWPQGGGVFMGEWEFTDAVPAKPVAPAPVITTKPAASPKPAPITTVSSKHSSSTKIPASSASSSSKISSSTLASSTLSSSTSASSAATTSINYMSGVASGLAVPTGSIDRTGSSPSNLQDLNQFLVQIGGLAMAAGSL